MSSNNYASVAAVEYAAYGTARIDENPPIKPIFVVIVLDLKSMDSTWLGRE
ncbi:MAG: hypothetical protein MI867_21515 [Pseudomonadales bacterium]|nr:hypothetical protein [Pseudomonadales bacterium]